MSQHFTQLFDKEGIAALARVSQAARNGSDTVSATSLKLTELEFCPWLTGTTTWSKNVGSFLRPDQQKMLGTLRDKMEIEYLVQTLELVLMMGENIEKHYGPDVAPVLGEDGKPKFDENGQPIVEKVAPKLIAFTVKPFGTIDQSPVDRMLAYFGESFKDCFTPKGLPIFASRWSELHKPTEVEHKSIAFAIDRSGKVAWGMFNLETPGIPAGRLLWNLLRIDSLSQCDEDFIKRFSIWANNKTQSFDAPEVAQASVEVQPEVVQASVEVQPEVAQASAEVVETEIQRARRLAAGKKKAA